MVIRMQNSTFYYTATMGIVKQVTFIAAELATVVLRILRFGAIDACFYFADDSVECFHLCPFFTADLNKECTHLFAQFDCFFLTSQQCKCTNTRRLDHLCINFPICWRTIGST